MQLDEKSEKRVSGVTGVAMLVPISNSFINYFEITGLGIDFPVDSCKKTFKPTTGIPVSKQPITKLNLIPRGRFMWSRPVFVYLSPFGQYTYLVSVSHHVKPAKE
jgi:hypothetical protein